MLLKIVKVGDYTPSKFAYERGDRAPLSVPFFCVDGQRRNFQLNVLGTRPRFWAETDPRELMDAVASARSAFNSSATVFRELLDQISEVSDEGYATFGTNQRCWTVYVDYPFQVVTIRDALHNAGVKTCAGDVVYKTAVRVYNGLKSPYIEVPDGKSTVDISEVRSVVIDD